MFWPMASLLAVGQGSWQQVLPTPSRIVRITDAVESESGTILVAALHTNDADMQGQGRLIKVDATGEIAHSRMLWQGDLMSPFAILPDSQGSTLRLVGDYRDSAGYGGFLVSVDTDLTGLDSSLYPIPDLFGASLDNALVTTAGEMLLPLFVQTLPDFFPDAVEVIRLTSQGDSISSSRFTSPFFLAARDIVQVAENEFLIACAGTLDSPEFENGYDSYLRITGDLQFIGGFRGVPFDGSNELPTRQSTLHDHHCLHLLESGNLIVGGKAGSLSSGHQGVLQKLTHDGEWLGAVVFDTEFHNDHPAILRNSSMTNEGDLLFALVANFESGPPSPFLPEEPSRVQIYKLDTSLNVICTNVIDGFAENTYYFVDRIIATNDGGYLTVGSKVDLSDPERPWVGWARKFGPDDCFTGLNEEAGAPLVMVAPNPGRDELRIVLNGLDRRASAELHDLSGRLVATESLIFGQARFDTKALATGVYAYIISDGAGNRIASGRWVKE